MLDTLICRYDLSLKDQLIEFLTLMWGNMDAAERRKFFEWIYENNPYAQRPFVYLALHNERIVAYRAFVIQKFVHGDDEFLVGVPSGAVVHPDFRRHGLFSKLTDYAFEDMLANSSIRLLLSLSSNEASTAGNIKSGFIPVGEREYVRYISPLIGLNRFFQSKSDLDEAIIFNKGDITIEITSELKIQEISNLMRSFVGADKLCNIRDKESYTWRFARSPYQYIYAYSREGGETTGYLALQKKSNNVYSLMEYGYSKPIHFNYLIEETSKKTLAPVIVAPTFTRSQKELSEINRSGFYSSNDRRIGLLKALKLIRNHSLPGAIVKPVSLESNDNAYLINGVDTRLSQSWSLFQSDVW